MLSFYNRTFGPAIVVVQRARVVCLRVCGCCERVVEYIRKAIHMGTTK